jgi:hypothetical protein
VSDNGGEGPDTGRRPQEQQESVHAPYRDPRPPKRSVWTVIWLTVAILAVFALGIALIVAAIDAA